jgi:hypothetical protein
MDAKFQVGDLVEVIAGNFKGLRLRVIRFDGKLIGDDEASGQWHYHIGVGSQTCLLCPEEQLTLIQRKLIFQ